MGGSCRCAHLARGIVPLLGQLQWGAKHSSSHLCPAHRSGARASQAVTGVHTVAKGPVHRWMSRPGLNCPTTWPSHSPIHPCPCPLPPSPSVRGALICPLLHTRLFPYRLTCRGDTGTGHTTDTTRACTQPTQIIFYACACQSIIPCTAGDATGAGFPGAAAARSHAAPLCSPALHPTCWAVEVAPSSLQPSAICGCRNLGGGTCLPILPPPVHHLGSPSPSPTVTFYHCDHRENQDLRWLLESFCFPRMELKRFCEGYFVAVK